MRWKVMTGTVLLWCLILAALLWQRVRTSCTNVIPNDYETPPDFQIVIGLMVWLPLLFPVRGVLLLAEAFLLQSRRCDRSIGSSTPT